MGQPAAARSTRRRGCRRRMRDSSARPRAAPGGSSRPSSARATRSCRPTTSRRTRRRSSPIARRRPTSGCTCWRPSPRAISAGSGRWRPSTGSRRRSRPWAGSSASGATSTTGTRRPTFARSSPATCPRWTAGIWRPAPRSRRNACREALERPLLRSRGLRRNRGRACCSCARRRAPSWTTGARRPSGSAIWTKPARPWSRRFATRPRTAADWVARLGQLAGQADALVDIARTLTAERGDGEDSDVLVWAQATRATIASHRRDLDG